MAIEIGPLQPSALRQGAAQFAGLVLGRAGSLPIVGPTIQQVVREARDPNLFVGRLLAENIEDKLRKNYACMLALRDCTGDTSAEETELIEQAGLASRALFKAEAYALDSEHADAERLQDVIEVLPELSLTQPMVPTQYTGEHDREEL